MPILALAPVAATAFWGAVGAGVAGTAAVINAKTQAGATETAANTQATATMTAAQLTAKATADALAFSKAQAENEYQNSQVAAKANYDQTAAQRARLGTLGAMLGLPAPVMPPFQPGVDPNYTGATPGVPVQPLPSSTTTPTSGPTTAGASPSGAAAATSNNPLDPSAIQAQLTANYKSLGLTPTGPGTGPTDIAYYAKQIAATGGLTPQNSAYWFGPSGRIASDAAKAKSGTMGTTAGVVPPPTSGTLGTLLAPYQIADPTAPLAAPGMVG